MDIVRVFTGPDGQSHFEDVAVEFDELGAAGGAAAHWPGKGAAGRISALWPTKGVQFREVDGENDVDFHNAPARRLIVNLTGSIEVEVGSGERRRFGPGSILLAEDMTGQGHISHVVGEQPRTSLTIHLA